MNIDVYISAGSDDSAKAQWLGDYFEANGIGCWISSRDRDPGLRYGKIDPRRVQESRLMIAVRSPAGDRRAVCLEERCGRIRSPNRSHRGRQDPRANRCFSASKRGEDDSDVAVADPGLYLFGSGRRGGATIGISIARRGATGVGGPRPYRARLLERGADNPTFWSGHSCILALGSSLHRTASTIVAHACVDESRNGQSIWYAPLLQEATGLRELAASERLERMAQQTASANAAVSRWLYRPGKEFIRVGHFSVAGNPPPDFSRDFLHYVEEFAKKSLRSSNSPSEIQTGTWPIVFSGEQPIFIPGRIRDSSMGAGMRRGSSRPYKPPPVTKATILRKAHFSAFAPSTVTPGDEFILEIWACFQSEHEYAEVVERATRGKKFSDVGGKEGVPVELGSWLTISVTIPAFGIQSLLDRMYWDGSIANTSFGLGVPRDAGEGCCVVRRRSAQTVYL
jgi:hypothetical protein